MRTIGVLIKKELMSLFLMPVAYILIFVFLLVNGYTFWILLSALNDPRVQVNSSAMNIFFGGTVFFWITVILICAVLTMRLFSEEKRQDTMELLMTAPVRDAEVVLGKFFAGWLFYAILWMPTVGYALLLQFYSSVDWGPVASGYLGVLCLGALLISIGLFASSLTKNQIIAAVLSFVFSVFLFSLSFLEFFLPIPEWQPFFNYFSMLAHFDDFGKGVIDTRVLVYYGSLTLFFLYLTLKTIESRRWK